MHVDTVRSQNGTCSAHLLSAPSLLPLSLSLYAMFYDSYRISRRLKLYRNRKPWKNPSVLCGLFFMFLVFIMIQLWPQHNEKTVIHTQYTDKQNIITEMDIQKAYHEAIKKQQDEAMELAYELRDLKIVWEGVLSICDGFGVEAANTLVALAKYFPDNLAIAIGGNHEWCPGMPQSMMKVLRSLRDRDASNWNVDILLLHKAPDRYIADGYPHWAENKQPYHAPRYRVGRSMWEESHMTPEQTKRVQLFIDEIWVPSRGVVEMFTNSHADPGIIHVVPEPVNDLMVAHRPNTRMKVRGATAPDTFNFLFVGKLEARKGWDTLLQSFIEAFRMSDKVALWMHTYDTETGSQDVTFLQAKLRDFAAAHAKKMNIPSSYSAAQKIFVFSQTLDWGSMPFVYTSMDAFISTTHGEGFGLPIIEAMAFGLPTLATNYSGPVEFMTANTSFILPVDHMEDSHPEYNAQFAVASVGETSRIMRYVFDHPEEAKQVGMRGRLHILMHFNQDAVALQIVKRLHAIKERMYASSAACAIHNQFIGETDDWIEDAIISHNCCWLPDDPQPSDYQAGCFDLLSGADGLCLCQDGRKVKIDQVASRHRSTCAQICSASNPILSI